MGLFWSQSDLRIIMIKIIMSVVQLLPKFLPKFPLTECFCLSGHGRPDALLLIWEKYESFFMCNRNL